MAHEKIKQGVWNSKQANVNMLANGIHENLRSNIINHEHADKDIIEIKILSPIWNTPDGISSMPDVPMHLLFLNLTKPNCKYDLGLVLIY